MKTSIRNLIVRLFVGALMLLPIFGVLMFLSTMTKEYHCSHNSLSIKTISPIAKISWPENGLLTIWFNDAYISQTANEVMSLLKKNTIIGVISASIDDICTAKYMSWEQLQQFQSMGWEIIPTLAPKYCEIAKFNSEAVQKVILRFNTEFRTRGLNVNPEIVCKVSKYILPNFIFFGGKKYSPIQGDDDENELNLMPIREPGRVFSFIVDYKTTEDELKQIFDITIKENAWLILEFHHIDNEHWSNHISLAKFQHVLELIKASKIPLVLPSQVLEVSK